MMWCDKRPCKKTDFTIATAPNKEQITETEKNEWQVKNCTETDQFWI